MKLNSDIILGFVGTCLINNFDDPKPIPNFHLELWDLMCSDHKYVAIAAPRGHAKTTAGTLTFVLACLAFRQRDHILIVSDTMDQAIAFLGDIKKEILENEDLRSLFGFASLVKDREDEFIGMYIDGTQYRVLARGSEQRLRGMIWRSKRPNLVIGDDLENDEIVLNDNRREKFRNWFFKALIPAGSDNCLYRIVGTILHLDSLLERLMPSDKDPETINEPLKQYSDIKDKVWHSVRYRAHDEDFSNILWPEKFNKDRLQQIKRLFVEQGDAEGYSQEYLNYPIDPSTAYFKKSDIIPMEHDDYEVYKEYYAAADLAISEKDRSAFTAIVVVGLDRSDMLHIVDVRRFRGDAYDIINEIFSVQLRWKPELFILEQENIARSIGSILRDEQVKKGIYINIEPVVSTTDKLKRARSIQLRFRARQIKTDHESDWSMDFIEELVQFPKGRYKDQVDALSHIGLILDKMAEVKSKEELDDEEYWEEFGDSFTFSGRSAITGY